MNASSGFSIGNYRSVHHYRPLDELRPPWSHNIDHSADEIQSRSLLRRTNLQTWSAK
jgi:hypothetical protein